MLSFFPRGVFGEILNLIESVSEGFPSYSFVPSGKESIARDQIIQVALCVGAMIVSFGKVL